jgi:polyribonucleotide nucleotidyltransferase
MHKVFKTEISGREFVVETGKMAQLANGSCLVRFGETVILCAATASAKPREGIDFFPLSVDFEERLYAVGKIPGGFIKREGRPSEKAVLTSRLIDRPIRPLFPKNYRNDVALVLTVMSVEQDNSPEIAAMIGASIALSISDIPFMGPIGGVSVGLIDGEFIINPNEEQRNASQMAITVAATKNKVVMIEAGANQVEEQVVYDGIMRAHEEIKKICAFIDEIVAEVGKQKAAYIEPEFDYDLYEKVKKYASDKVKYALDTDDKNVREERLNIVFDEIVSHFESEIEDISSKLGEIIYKLQKK